MKVLFLLLFLNYSLFGNSGFCDQDLALPVNTFYKQVPNTLFLKNAIMMEHCLSYTTWQEMIYMDLFHSNYKHSKEEFALVKNKYKIFEKIIILGGNNIQVEKLDILILMMQATVVKAIENNYGTLEDFERFGSEEDFEEWKKMF